MRNSNGIFRILVFLCCCASVSAIMPETASASHRLADVTVVVANDAPPMAKLAASEVRRYVYLLTGTLPAIAPEPPSGKVAIIIKCGTGSQVPADGPDPRQNFALYRQENNQVVQGASEPATLWAAYHLIESWGVGFYLGGDAIPPADPRRMVELVETRQRPTLTVRGNLPWFNFLNSPTTWNPQDYKTFFAQMAKQKANFIGFHAYDHEPFCAYDVTRNEAKMGGPLMTTISPHRWWSPPAMSTKDFLFGTGCFFDRGEWGCEVGIEDAWTYAPGRATRLQQAMMAEALSYARQIGLKTCIGFEVTGNSEEPAVREAFVKRLANVLALYPLDYLWIWQSEGRGTSGAGGNWVAGAPNDPSLGVTEEVRKAFAYMGPQHDLRESARITKYVQLAYDVLKEKAPKTGLIVSGWGGDAHMQFTTLYEGLDKVVPPDVIFASLDNIDPRSQDHVSDVYGKVRPERQRWPIPWFESDGGRTRADQTGPQTNVTAFEPLLKDIVKKGCQGALGIHWRARNVEDVAGYLYRFGWNPQLTATEFFRQYARDHYGQRDAEEMAKVHLRLEEFGPGIVGAVGCVECSTPFNWFAMPGSAEQCREPNLAGHLPVVERFSELDELADELMRREETAKAQKRDHAAIEYHDLAQTIRWLVIRARVGLAIWNDEAPLTKRLREAEALFDKGNTTAARDAAKSIASELQSLDFQQAMQALASTCRTRGELGMLATANARYGRFYAAFVQRLIRILGEPLPESRGSEPCKGPEVLTVYPVPGYIGSNQSACFDAVLLPKSIPPWRAGSADPQYGIELRELSGGQRDKIILPLRCLGGAYYRAAFLPLHEGVWSWTLMPANHAKRGKKFPPLPHGAITIGPPVVSPAPSSRVSPVGDSR